MDQKQNNQSSAPNPSPKQQIVEAIKAATNLLVTVSTNPSVDQLAACIGLTLMLNKLDKHATAVFSGQVPSTLEFLQPEKTIEPNTDSLRDFIISLDRSKADKLRYKVEDNSVKIFITPYHTSISSDDLQFSQGDFNVDVVIALGVDNNDHLDQAIVSHGRILHDATVVGLSCGSGSSDVGSINWHEDNASSLSEMIVSISEAFQSGLLDGQMATSFLTGIVAETERFSNKKTTPKVMTMSAQLMAAGANQQLISTQLAPAPTSQSPAEEKAPEPAQEPPKPVEPDVSPEEVKENLPPPVPMTPPKEEFEVSKNEEINETSDMILLQEAEKELENAEDVNPEEIKSPESDDPTPGPIVRDEPDEKSAEDKEKEIHIDEEGHVHDSLEEADRSSMKHERVIKPLSAEKKEGPKTDISSYIFEPPANGGTFTGATQDDPVKEAAEHKPETPENDIPMLSHDQSALTESTDKPATGAPDVLPTASEEPIAPEGVSFAPSLLNSVDPSVVAGALKPPDPAASSTDIDTMDPLAGMTPTVVGAPGLPPLPDIPPPSEDPATATPADAEAARQAVMNAQNTNPPLIRSPIDALNAAPISLEAPMVSSSTDSSAVAPPPVPPPMIMPQDNSTLPPPIDENTPVVEEPTNPFNLPPVR